MKIRKLFFKFPKIFGNDLQFNVFVGSILFALILFFYILFVGSYFKPTVYPLIDRVTYTAQFIDKYFINSYSDKLVILLGITLWFLVVVKGNLKLILSFFFGVFTIIAFIGYSPLIDILTLSSLPTIIMLIIYNKIKEKKLLYINKQIYLNYISILGILLGIISIYLLLLRLLFPELSLPNINYLYHIFLLSSIFSPILLILISVFFPIKIYIKKLVKKIAPLTDKNKEETYPLISPQHLNLKTRFICFFLIIALSITITIIPHIYTINKDNQLIGDDSKDYALMLNSINKESSVSKFLNQAFFIQMSGDRPLSLIYFYLWEHLINPNNITNSIEYLPLFLGPALIFCIYFLTIELTSNHFTGLLASFFTVISFHLLVGIYGGLYANWFSLIFGYLAILFLFRSLKKSNKSNIILFSILMVITMLSHLPTWTILTLVVIILLGVMLKLKQYNKKIIGYLFLALVPSILYDGFRMILTKYSGIKEDINFAHSQSAGIHDISTFWINLINTTHTYMAGLFGNSIIFIVILYWLYKSNIKDKSAILMVVFLSLNIFPIVFGEQQIQTRFLYEIPFQIPFAIALTLIRKYQGNLIFCFICLWLITIAIRSSSNFYLVQH